jgi:hypothetical protein
VGSLVRTARCETLGVTNRDLSEGEVKRHLEWLRRSRRQADLHAAAVLRRAVPGGDAVSARRLSEKFGRYFTSTIGYMLALAIDEGYDWIGCTASTWRRTSSIAQQRPNAEYFIGLARGMGKTVEIAPASALCKAGISTATRSRSARPPGSVNVVAQHRTKCNDERREGVVDPEHARRGDSGVRQRQEGRWSTASAARSWRRCNARVHVETGNWWAKKREATDEWIANYQHSLQSPQRVAIERSSASWRQRRCSKSAPLRAEPGATRAGVSRRFGCTASTRAWKR